MALKEAQRAEFKNMHFKIRLLCFEIMDVRFHLKTGATWFIKGGLCNSCYAPLNILFATPSNQTRYQREISQMRNWNNSEYNSDTKEYRSKKYSWKSMKMIEMKPPSRLKSFLLVLKRDINLFRLLNVALPSGLQSLKLGNWFYHRKNHVAIPSCLKL